MREKIEFDFSNTSLFKEDYEYNSKKLHEELELMRKSSYSDERASLNLVEDLKNIKIAEDLSSKFKDSTMLVVIGIGGSNLGTLAVYEALKGKSANEFNSRKIYFADTVDSFSILDIKTKMAQEFKNKGKVILNVISKSGGTTETLANFYVLYEELEKHVKNSKDYVVFTTDKDSKLDSFANSNGYKVLHIPKNVGGRYSVFSQVGLFPLSFMGINISQLLKGALDMKNICLNNSIEENPAMMSSVSIFNAKKSGKQIIDTFFFISKFEAIGRWYRQLMGESIAKEQNKSKSKMLENSGLTPTVSIGSTDLHSMAQLYLAGTKNKFHIFVETSDFPEVKINKELLSGKDSLELREKSLSQIMDAILQGTQKAFQDKHIPYYRVILNEISEYSIGAFLQMKMMEMMFLGVLFDVNPFDQPNVEEYKVHTKKILQGDLDND